MLLYFIKNLYIIITLIIGTYFFISFWLLLLSDYGWLKSFGWPIYISVKVLGGKNGQAD